MVAETKRQFRRWMKVVAAVFGVTAGVSGTAAVAETTGMLPSADVGPLNFLKNEIKVVIGPNDAKTRMEFIQYGSSNKRQNVEQDTVKVPRWDDGGSGSEVEPVNPDLNVDSNER